MTIIKEIRKDDKLVGFEVSGHANYSSYGSDVVCAAISFNTINTINSILLIGKSSVEQANSIAGDVVFKVDGNMNNITESILESAKLGYVSIAEEYPGNAKYERK